MQLATTLFPDWLERALASPLEFLVDTQHDLQLPTLLARAEVEIELRRYANARAIAAAIAEHPQRQQLEYRCLILSLSARLLLLSGNIAEGFHRFHDALDCCMDSSTALIHFQWAKALETIGNYGDALNHLLQTLKQLGASDSTGLVYTHSSIARIQQQLHDHQSSYQTLQHAADAASCSQLHQYVETQRAALLVETDAAQNAIEVLNSIRTAASSSPVNALMAISQELILVRAYLHLKRWDDAGSLAEALITRTAEYALPYHSAEAHYLFAQTFGEQSSPYYSPPLAIEQYKRALQQIKHIPAGPLHAELHFALASIYRSIGHHRNAYAHLEQYSSHVSKSLSVQSLHRVKQIEIKIATESMRLELLNWERRYGELMQKLSEAQQTVESTKKLLDEQITYLGVVAHDLKNPLAAIMMSASILDRYGDRLGKDDRDKHIQNITRTAEWMKGLITSLLDYTALSTGRLKLAIESVHATMIMDTVIEAYQLRALAKSLTIHKKYPTDDVYVLADSQRLQECLDNLLSNAIKYSPLGRSIYCIVENRGTHIRFAIQDEGPGLTAEEQQALFRQFSRARSYDTGSEGGTGLGLSIVRRFVEAMNGMIFCESAPGCGSTFVIELPLAATQYGAQHGSQSLTAAPQRAQIQ